MQYAPRATRPARELVDCFMMSLEAYDFMGPEPWPIAELREAQSAFVRALLAAYGPVVPANPEGYFMSRVEFCSKVLFWEAIRRILERALVMSEERDRGSKDAAACLRKRASCAIRMLKVYEAGAGLTMHIYSEEAEALLNLTTKWEFQNAEPPFKLEIAELGWLVDEMWFVFGSIRGQLLRDVKQSFSQAVYLGDI